MNKRKYLAPVLALGMTLGFSSGVSAETSTVTFEQGDTIWGVAEEYEDVSVSDLYEWNPGIDADIIQVGSEITIKTDEEVQKEQPNQDYHTVESGDTLYSIATEYKGVTLGDIYELNPNINAWSLSVGSYVRISPDLHTGTYHYVLPGTTYFSIAQEYEGVTVEDLRELNPSKNPFALQVGSKVRVK
ncbi:LysM peptidoglycan-binding domain-containing protein [Halobacillus yeomjeoni]|uniref:LysM peptidoglycan-binding domain-containing protein n=1 Tax=Halobacillus yeomjeoni TaxID=311194 RepID=A0A931HXP0_9BACI|nr:LysM peptidoglycan-binding domain-containing protein [Halobacillus yeomjeoni]MBH0231368.1 LysM peptidoglycan-binding domain-containing protein [Halobacillus yeomjeoni]